MVDKKFGMLTETLLKLWNTYLTIPMTCYRKEKLRQTLLKLYGIYIVMSNRMKGRSMWVRPIFTVEERLLQGDSDNLVKKLKSTDHALYFNYLRMTSDIFDELLEIVGPRIKKQVAIREPIPTRTRLQICLRYLASGDSMKSIAYAFRVAPSTVSEIIEETCDEIWKGLKDIVLRLPSKEDWIAIAKEFNDKWHFIHCVGAMDGRHMVLEVCTYTIQSTF